MDISYVIGQPSPSDFARLRNLAGWGDVTQEQAQRALANSIMSICLYDEAQHKTKHLIAMARCVGDGVFNVYIQDVIVKPCYQGQGLGRTMLKALITNMTKALNPNCTIGLMAAEGQCGFYTQFGFKVRPNTGFGPGMSAQLKELSL